MNNNRITMDDIKAAIADVKYTVDGTLTIAVVTLTNGSKHVGESACVDPANFNKELGEEYALKNAIDTSIWKCMGFALLDRNYRSTQLKASMPADEMFDGFKPYESKPIVRMAMEIDDINRVLEVDTNTYQYAGIRFKAYQQPLAGDFVVRLTRDDTYHVARSVFLDRNIVPE